MAVNPLSLAESLRPWRAAGVTHFLREVLGDGDAATQHAETFLSDAPGMPAASVTQEERGAPLQSGPVGTAQQSEPWHRPQAPDFSDASSAASAPVFARDGAAKQPAPHSGQPQAGERSARLPEGGKPDAALPGTAPAIPPGSWPPAWQALFARTRPAPVIWTYPELGLDLSGQGSKERSACLREIIGKLQLPRGSSAFWPLYLEEGGSGEAEVFNAGLCLLQPKVIVLVGARAARLADAGLALGTPFTQQIARGMLFVLLPDFAALLESPSLADKACVFLRTALGGINSVLHGR